MRHRILTKMLDFFPSVLIDKNLNIVEEVIREIIVELNNQFGQNLCDEKCVKRIIKREQVYLTILKSKLRRSGVKITQDPVNIDQKNFLKMQLLSSILGVLILRNTTEMKNCSFYLKFQKYVKLIGISNCEWINKTRYDNYFAEYLDLAFEIYNDHDKLRQVNYLDNKQTAMFQTITRIEFMNLFFSNTAEIDDLLVDQHINIFRDLCAVFENYTKFLYLVKNVNNLPKNVEDIEFHKIWKNLKDDNKFITFASPLPNTDILNASKHLGIHRKIDNQKLSYQSNRLPKPLEITYQDFVNITRELYACTITLVKIKLILILVSGKNSKTINPSKI
jgi:hypothetical protein